MMGYHMTVTCDCCGADVSDADYGVTVSVCGRDKGFGEPYSDRYFYCDSCSRYLWEAVRAIPRIRQLREQ